MDGHCAGFQNLNTFITILKRLTNGLAGKFVGNKVSVMLNEMMGLVLLANVLATIITVSMVSMVSGEEASVTADRPAA